MSTINSWISRGSISKNRG